MFVIDASITLAWCITDRSSDIAEAALDRLAREEAIAPSIWALEVANGLRSAERRGRLEVADRARIDGLLKALPIRMEPVGLPKALGSVSELARTLDLTAYDAAYLELAATRGLALATADDRLRRACERAGVPMVAREG